MIRPGEEWGTPASTPADVRVSGDDTALARMVEQHPGALIRFEPGERSDLADAVGLQRTTATGDSTPPGTEAKLDALRVNADGCTGPLTSVNMVVLGVAPGSLGRFTRRFGAQVRVNDKTVFHGPCTTIVIATGQFRAGLDLVPRGHPGDGRAEVQVYAVPGRQRRQLRSRLATGTHVPHPAISQHAGAHVTVTTGRRVPLEIDGRSVLTTAVIEVTVLPGAYRLLL